MNKIEEIVDSIENKISKLLHKQEVLRQNNAKLTEELADQKKRYQDLEVELGSWVDKYDNLKIANSLLGSDDNNKETKLKINALIRDIDHCIAQLSE